MSTTRPVRGADGRALGFSEVLALGVNCVVGSGVFLLPGLVADGAGPVSLLAVAAAGAVACLIALCFAEASSRFRVSGGAYTYARAAFGDAGGFFVGWVAMLAGLLAWAAIVNAFAVALAGLTPAASSAGARTVAIGALLAVVGTLNVVGVRMGAGLSTALTLIKALALGGFVIAGLFFLEPARFVPFAPHGWGAVGSGALLMFYAFVGFENLVVPAGEVRDPGRSLPRAILIVMAGATVLYLCVQAVVAGTLVGFEGKENAVAAAAGAFLGPAGGKLVAAAVVISVLGVNAASALILPRRISALAEQGDLPEALARQHPRFATPYRAVVLAHLLVLVIALSGSFRELVALAVIARFLQYAPTCLGVLVLRRTDRDTPGETRRVHAPLRLPFGSLVPLLALAASALLLASAEARHLVLGVSAVAVGVPVYAAMRRRRTRPGSDSLH